MPSLSGDVHMGKPTLDVEQISRRELALELFYSLCGSLSEESTSGLQALGLLVYNEYTYYYHQKHLLIPAIVKYW